MTYTTAMSACRYDITFVGRVQGVGFRFTTARAAGKFEVFGWVRNEPDGTVRCVVEGEKDELNRFVAAIQEHMAGNITETQIQERSTVGEFSGFSIR